MSALQVVATIPAKAGSEDAIKQALSELATATRQEEGCLRYDLFESASAPGTFVTVEEWRSQDDLDSHMTSPQVAAAFAGASDHLAGEVVIHPLQPVS